MEPVGQQNGRDDGSEDEPHAEREEDARLFGVFDRLGRESMVHRSEAYAAHEGRDEAVPPQGDCSTVGEQRECESRDIS